MSEEVAAIIDYSFEILCIAIIVACIGFYVLIFAF